ncbi:MAG: chloramphenicol acetyltransferase [Candidatus Neomarinimicrobiota bacterium]|nr:MAG: chloramphenicol acetyltransferase [Candidatus Neomarinimicrobiota bacterium]
MKQYVDLNTWERKDQFQHFIKYSDPYFGITTNVDCTTTYAKAKELGVSFFLYYFYLSLDTANAIPEFRTRLEKGKAVIFDKVNGSPTVLRNDGGLGFAMLEFQDSFEEFLKFAEPELERVKALPELDASKDCPETIYYSIMPWIKFTSVTHPMDLPNTEGVPILTFGKMFKEKEKRLMPLGVYVHHALMDGMHVARFVELFQRKLSLNIES